MHEPFLHPHPNGVSRMTREQREVFFIEIPQERDAQDIAPSEMAVFLNVPQRAYIEAEHRLPKWMRLTHDHPDLIMNAYQILIQDESPHCVCPLEDDKPNRIWVRRRGKGRMLEKST